MTFALFLAGYIVTSVSMPPMIRENEAMSFSLTITPALQIFIVSYGENLTRVEVGTYSDGN